MHQRLLPFLLRLLACQRRQLLAPNQPLVLVVGALVVPYLPFQPSCLQAVPACLLAQALGLLP